MSPGGGQGDLAVEQPRAAAEGTLVLETSPGVGRCIFPGGCWADCRSAGVFLARGSLMSTRGEGPWALRPGAGAHGYGAGNLCGPCAMTSLRPVSNAWLRRK